MVLPSMSFIGTAVGGDPTKVNGVSVPLADKWVLSKDEIAEVLSRCNYSESFVKTANDLQVLDAISACYEEYKILKRR
mgnify:CR=1 FL=1